MSAAKVRYSERYVRLFNLIVNYITNGTFTGEDAEKAKRLLSIYGWSVRGE
jgi:hypothetical protein